MSRRNDWTSIGGPTRQFPLTSWSLLQQAQGSSDGERQTALDELALAYWKPLYCFLRAEGRANDEAKDLVQGFFVSILDDDPLRNFDPAKPPVPMMVRHSPV